jgi:hypothetical protein
MNLATPPWRAGCPLGDRPGEGYCSLAAILRQVLPALGRLTPQGTAHAKTIYSLVNVIRRCPPGQILATLEANPDFANVGGHYWQLAE